MRLQKDLREFIELLNSKQVDYVIVGAHALAYHGYPRYTADLDILIRVSESNARKLQEVITAFGFEDTGLRAQDFLSENQVIQLGVSPNRIDIVTALTGVAFDDAWTDRVETELDGIPIHMLSRECLIRNKKALGRPKDIADLDFLEER